MLLQQSLELRPELLGLLLVAGGHVAHEGDQFGEAVAVLRGLCSKGGGQAGGVWRENKRCSSLKGSTALAVYQKGVHEYDMGPKLVVIRNNHSSTVFCFCKLLRSTSKVCFIIPSIFYTLDTLCPPPSATMNILRST